MDIKKLIKKSITVSILLGLLLISVGVNVWNYFYIQTWKAENKECRRAFDLDYYYSQKVDATAKKLYEVGEKCHAALYTYADGGSYEEKDKVISDYVTARNEYQSIYQETLEMRASRSAEIASFQYFLTDYVGSINK